MADIESKKAALDFVARWTDKGQEDEHARSFWIELMQDVLGVENPTHFLNFEKKVKIKGGSTKRIDVYIPSKHVLIEQKSLDIDLDKPQKGHFDQTPFEQAKYYNDNLNISEKARWIIVSNFKETRVYDMDDMLADPTTVMLSELPEKISAFDMLKAEKADQIRFEEKISYRAGTITGHLYDALIKQYADPESPETLSSLNQLCVRLVFCLYAEDAGIFEDNQFHDYIAEFKPEHIRNALKALFKILDTPDSERDQDEEKNLLAFPYVNGGLFKDESVRIPQFNEEIKTVLLDEASAGIDWSEISPTIFGAVFESTLNPDSRRSGGMHYTSVENIHKVIDPLFLDDLKAELEEIKLVKQLNVRNKKLSEFQDKLAGLKFLDPACGSGNFLTETYLSLRRLENEAITIINGDQAILDAGDIIKVSIGQFYGIEINDFAVTVARTALWIAESQMMRETAEIVKTVMEFLPLKSNANIVEGNALRLDWESVVPKAELNFIMGNPPFVGARLMSKEQKDDLFIIFDGVKNNGNLDYVSCWYKKTADYISGTAIRAALVSTNSITQGEQVAILWKKLFEQGVHIDYAYKTFIWNNEAPSKGQAHVHCVIVGFSKAPNSKEKKLFDNDTCAVVSNINGYLVEADDIVIESRQKPISSVPEIGIGNQPIDDGNYLFTEEEMKEFIKKEPKASQYFKKWLGSKEFINGYFRYCLLLGECSPKELRSMPECLKRVDNVRKFRLESKRTSTLKLAETPTRFQTENMPDKEYLLIPRVSSENRKYIPIGYISSDTISSDSVHIIANATLYHFGILTSSVHMAWMRAVAGRLEMRYRYSKDIVYNNFPWCTPSAEQKAKIEQTAQGVLDARAKFPDSSLADLYDELTMPPELRSAHRANDKAVMQAYGFDPAMSEQEIVAELMKMYRELVEG